MPDPAESASSVKCPHCGESFHSAYLLDYHVNGAHAARVTAANSSASPTGEPSPASSTVQEPHQPSPPTPGPVLPRWWLPRWRLSTWAVILWTPLCYALGVLMVNSCNAASDPACLQGAGMVIALGLFPLWFSGLAVLGAVWLWLRPSVRGRSPTATYRMQLLHARDPEPAWLPESAKKLASDLEPGNLQAVRFYVTETIESDYLYGVSGQRYGEPGRRLGINGDQRDVIAEVGQPLGPGFSAAPVLAIFRGNPYSVWTLDHNPYVGGEILVPSVIDEVEFQDSSLVEGATSSSGDGRGDR